MTKFPLFLAVCGGLSQLACGEEVSPASGASGSGGSSTAASAGAGGASPTRSGGAGNVGNGNGGAAGAPADPLPKFADQPHHLGAPFRIVDGRISADSNEYGLEASFYTIHNAKDTPANVTTTTGQICVNGGVRRASIGDYAKYSGIDLGFSVGPTSYRTLTETLITMAPEAPPWTLPPGVLGLAVTLTGSAPARSSFYTTPGGQDIGGQHGVLQDLTMYATCNHAPFNLEQPSKEFFGDLQNFWCLPDLTERWSSSSVSAFLWTVDTIIVNEIVPGGENDGVDPYDFCLRDLRPILAGAGPDAPLSDADAGPGEPDGGAGSTDAGPPDAGL